MKLSELTRKDEIGIVSIDGFLPHGMDADLSDPQYDSRRVTKGSTFVAIKGFTVDGHKFIAASIEKGASIVVIEDGSALSEGDAIAKQVTRIIVKDTRAALAHIAELYFDEPSKKLRIIGVTGTNGKTTTTNVIKQLLEAGNEKVGLIGTIGTWIGDEHIPTTHTTPESRDLSELMARMVSEGVETCVMEVSSHALELKRVAALDFDIAVFTNLTQDHLDFHSDMEAYCKAKQKLFKGLKDTAVAISNADSPYCDKMIGDTIANSHTYGVLKEGDTFGHADLVASNIRQSLDITRFTLSKRYSDESAEFETSLIGRFNIENVLAALTALYFGIEGYSLTRLAELLPRVQAIRGRFEQVALPNGSIAIVDYAHTPDALENVIRTARSLMEQTGSVGRLWVVFGCGGDRDRQKRPLMGSIASNLADRIILTNDNPRSEDPRDILTQIEAGLEPGSDYEVIEDRRKAIETALSATSSSDVVVIAGKGHETYQIIGKETTHFDDREEVLNWASATANARAAAHR
ncbi:MAG TPA: UDP-N-acetylmuramoyl-L-alanyl-D-glutamate--2,6-diaminopimelate ligase [Candidatus Kapabacteria bacterium]|nr:UDP-N-acetylmuramoyl-L-alanyl-D-glutamate--2,6-diaminopimelate ligase [Candidatus Kapabacteria bacterium]